MAAGSSQRTTRNHPRLHSKDEVTSKNSEASSSRSLDRSIAARNSFTVTSRSGRFASGIVAVPLGITRHAVEIFQELTPRKPTWSQNSAVDRGDPVHRVGKPRAAWRT